MFINLKLKSYINFYITSLPFVLFCGCFSLICDDRVFTREQMMLQVIEFLGEKIDDEKFIFFEYLF